jgi:hypothetical protein
MTSYTIDATRTFTVHRTGCAHLHLAEVKFDITATDDTADALLAAVDSAGSYRDEGTYVATAPCLPRSLRHQVTAIEDDRADV